jgi:hypothetical protein
MRETPLLGLYAHVRISGDDGDGQKGSNTGASTAYDEEQLEKLDGAANIGIIIQTLPIE